MGRAMVTRLGLGLLLLALLLPAQIYSTNETSTVVTSTNSSLSASTTPTSASSTSSTNATNGSDSVLQSASCLFMILLSLLHLYC